MIRVFGGDLRPVKHRPGRNDIALRANLADFNEVVVQGLQKRIAR
jgi:hypothetical protein